MRFHRAASRSFYGRTLATHDAEAHGVPFFDQAFSIFVNTERGIAGPSFYRSYRRRVPLPSISELDIQEQIAKLDMDSAKMMQPGDPNGHQVIIREVMPVGYFVTMPSGREGYLPAQDLGFSGGLAILQRLFKEGQEITVRIVCRGGAKQEIVSCKKPEFASPSEQKTVESMRQHFEAEKQKQTGSRRRFFGTLPGV